MGSKRQRFYVTYGGEAVDVFEVGTDYAPMSSDRSAAGVRRKLGTGHLYRRLELMRRIEEALRLNAYPLQGRGVSMRKG